MTRSIYLAVFANGPKPAHQAIYIPTGNAGPQGKVIHVTGSPAVGFFLEFKRNYNFADETRKYEIISLDEVADQYVTDTIGGGTPSIDTTARDRLESIATIVPTPGRSINPFDPEARNCQHWIEAYVRELVEQGIMQSSAVSVVENAPRLL